MYYVAELFIVRTEILFSYIDIHIFDESGFNFYYSTLADLRKVFLTGRSSENPESISIENCTLQQSLWILEN